MTLLLAGLVRGGGLVGIYDPGGYDAADQHAFRHLVGEGEAAPDSPLLVDGEIFNLDEVALQLQLPPGANPSSVIRAGASRWSLGVFRRLVGSFALVASISETQTLVAADPSAGRSIVFKEQDGRLLFASEIHLLLRLLPTRPAPSHVAVAHWLSFGTTRPAGETMYEGVKELQGGEALEFTPERWTRRRYWKPEFEPPADLSLAEAGELVWNAVAKATAARLGSREDIGIVMSGGVDSSVVAAGAAAGRAATRSRIRTYSAVFPGLPHLDETDRIDLLVESLDLENTQVHVAPGGALDLSLEWLSAWELPLRDLSYPLERPLLDLASREGVTGLLDGQYGDETFGAPTYLIADRLGRGRVFSSARLARTLPSAEQSHWDSWFEYGLVGLVPLAAQRAARRVSIGTTYLTRASNRVVAETDATEEWKKLRGPRWWAEKAHLLTVDRQADGIGTYARHRAALSGLEARPPLFDIGVVEAVLQVPPATEFDPVLDRASVRAAMAGRVPDEVRLSPWKSDLGPYYLEGIAGPDLDPIRRLLKTPKEVVAFARPDAIQSLIARAPRWRDRGWRAWITGVWKLATAECWLRYQEDPAWVDTLREQGLSRARGTIRRRRLS